MTESVMLSGQELRPALIVNRALLGMVLGEKLGEGCYRQVFTHAANPAWVVKLEERLSGRFCNVDEFNLWDEVKDEPKIAAWFAPVRFISACGSVLIQDRTQPLARLPAKVPNLFTDLKAENWGRLKGRPVMHDYANNRAIDLALNRFKLVDRR